MESKGEKEKGKEKENATQFSVFNLRANRQIYNEFLSKQERDRAYIEQLEQLLKSNHIEIPQEIVPREPEKKSARQENTNIMADGSLEALKKIIEPHRDLRLPFEVVVQYRDLTFWNMMAEAKIPTVGSALRSAFIGSGPKQRVDIFKNLTGRILPKTMTLLMGPPGCGKTSFLKALSGQLNVGSAHLDGEILYNGDPIDSGKYYIGKIATYVDEKETHAATLTVRETLEFAFNVTTKGHHSYGVAKDAASAEKLNEMDPVMAKVNNVLKVLGLFGVSDTLVGDGAIRGISGGQKRRVTLGEMLMPNRKILFMDAISNGLDAATTYDIVQSLSYVTKSLDLTTVISLLQPAPAVFYTFEDLILMGEGEIIYHGPTKKVLEYFESLGYKCPEIMDVADFLQEVPTADGKRFAEGNTTASGGTPPIGTEALVQAWKASEMYRAMVEAMDDNVKQSTGQWPSVYHEFYPGKFRYNFRQCLYREAKLAIRNTAFLKGRAMQALLVGGIAGSLFSNLPVEDSNTMSGILFFAALFGALSAMSMIPIIFGERAVFYKHSKALFYPTPAFVLAQTIVLYPLQILETVVFTSIVYWSVGLTSADGGSRYFSFMFIVLIFSLCVSQFFRLVASTVSVPTIAQPIAGVSVVMMVLFSGYIIPKSNVPPGWIWFYWINPIAYVLRSVTINEFLASDYDFPVCLNVACTQTQRFGDLVLESRGNPTDQVWVWYGVAVMVALYLLFLVLTTLALMYLRLEPLPPPPIPNIPADELVKEDTSKAEIPFEQVSFAFEDVWYTVQVGKGRKKEDLDLLRGVSGYFEPGTITALMGSSGAGKTTLLDVLAGRKTTGEIAGKMFINGKPKDEDTFRRMMGYVEQFDTLSPHDTAREAIEFSAALRLPGDTPAEQRADWVTAVLTMLELLPLQNTMIGSAENGGMSFEQKKRVSMGVELAANPSILFLDEPTSGLDSRAALVIIRCIKRLAASGRSIVCTIHQPSTVIFDAFDSLLLLRRGGQTVYFGELGESSKHLVSYLEAVPGVDPKPSGSNPATWMLEVIGAGTGTGGSTVDFHSHYCKSSLCSSNTTRINALCDEHAGEDDRDGVEEEPGEGAVVETRGAEYSLVPTSENGKKSSWNPYNTTYATQFRLLMYRFLLAYWRSPTYNLVRMIVSVVIALIFSSTYADQKYSTDVDVISRVALIYITVLFMGVVGMISVQPVMFSERPAFYREQFSEIYDVRLYTLAATLVEIPYLILSSVIFVIPYFYIVGFDKDGATDKFFWYWLYQALYMSVMVFLGHFLACALPNAATANVLGGMCSTFISLFCGFMIKAQDFPTFWTFMYWLDPLHYAIEGLVVTQFNGDETIITITGSPVKVTASKFVEMFYSEWEYRHRGYDILALCLFIIALRVCTYLSLEYLRHDKR